MSNSWNFMHKWQPLIQEIEAVTLIAIKRHE